MYRELQACISRYVISCRGDRAAPAAGSRPAGPDRYDPTFRKYSKRFFGVGFDWRIFKAQGMTESRLDPDAKAVDNADHHRFMFGSYNAGRVPILRPSGGPGAAARSEGVERDRAGGA